MALDTQVVKNIAHLARIAIDERELPTYATALSTILDFVDQMSSVDTRGVTPMAHPLAMSQRLREDAVTEVDQREHLQQHAPKVDNGLYLVPRVIE